MVNEKEPSATSRLKIPVNAKTESVDEDTAAMRNGMAIIFASTSLEIV